MLMRLEPYKLRVFMPVVVEPQVPDDGADVQLQEKRKLCALIQDALFLNFTSNENFRHLQHCSEDVSISQLMKAFDEFPWKVEAVQRLSKPEKIVNGKRFNSMLKPFQVNASKKGLQELE
jgi:hypothetical protein